MNLQQAIEIIDNIIAGVNCNRQQRQAIENAFRIIVETATKPKEKPKLPERKKGE